MKKIITLVFAMIFAFAATAQVDDAANKTEKVDLNTTSISTGLATGPRSGKLDYLNETFDTEIPATWTIVNNGTGNGWLWTGGTPYIDSDAAGSSAHESAELQSPVVAASGAGTLTLAFDSYYDNIGSDRAYIDVWDGSAWVTLEEFSTDHGTSSSDMVHFEYDISAYASDDLQIRFNYDDWNSWAWYWYIDNVVIFEPEDNDLGVTSVNPSGMIISGSTFTPTVTIENFGLLAQSTYDITLVSDPAGYDETISDPGTIDPGTTLTVYFPEWTPADGTYNLTGTVILTGDGNPGNDTYTSTIEVREPAFGDLVYAFDAVDPSCPGIETDGNNIYLTYWKDIAPHPFAKYDMAGNFIEYIDIAGVQEVRDLAYNPNTGFFYGAAANTSLFELDLDAQTLENTITIPTDSRAICYDDDDDTFWANNWDTPATEFDITGTATGNTMSVTSQYGMAYDNWTDPSNPTIWSFQSDAGSPPY